MRENGSGEISFRSIKPQDMAFLEKWYSMTDELGYATGFKSFAEAKERILSYPMVSMIIALPGGMAAGFVCCELRKLDRNKVGWIHIIMVDPAYQNRGIGTMAVRKLLECFQSRGCSAVMVSVSEQNTRGLRFWESLGFTRSRDMENVLDASGTSGVAIMKINLAGGQV